MLHSPSGPGHLVRAYRGAGTSVQVGQGLVPLHEFCGHDRRGTLVTSAAGDEGDLTTEDGPVHRVGEVIAT